MSSNQTRSKQAVTPSAAAKEPSFTTNEILEAAECRNEAVFLLVDWTSIQSINNCIPKTKKGGNVDPPMNQYLGSVDHRKVLSGIRTWRRFGQKQQEKMVEAYGEVAYHRKIEYVKNLVLVIKKQNELRDRIARKLSIQYACNEQESSEGFPREVTPARRSLPPDNSVGTPGIPSGIVVTDDEGDDSDDGEEEDGRDILGRDCANNADRGITLGSEGSGDGSEGLRSSEQMNYFFGQSKRDKSKEPEVRGEQTKTKSQWAGGFLNQSTRDGVVNAMEDEWKMKPEDPHPGRSDVLKKYQKVLKAMRELIELAPKEENGKVEDLFDAVLVHAQEVEWTAHRGGKSRNPISTEGKDVRLVVMAKSENSLKRVMNQLKGENKYGKEKILLIPNHTDGKGWQETLTSHFESIESIRGGLK